MELLRKILTPTSLPQALVTLSIILAAGYVLGMLVKQAPKLAFVLVLLLVAAFLFVVAPGFVAASAVAARSVAIAAVVVAAVVFWLL